MHSSLELKYSISTSSFRFNAKINISNQIFQKRTRNLLNVLWTIFKISFLITSLKKHQNKIKDWTRLNRHLSTLILFLMNTKNFENKYKDIKKFNLKKSRKFSSAWISISVVIPTATTIPKINCIRVSAPAPNVLPVRPCTNWIQQQTTMNNYK